MSTQTLTPQQELFAKAYGDCTGQDCRFLHFKTQVANMEDFETFARMIHEYNGFEAERVIDAMQPLFDHMSEVQIGREYSPVLYLTPSYRVPKAERITIANQAVRAFRSAEADEIGPDNSVLPDDAEFDTDAELYSVRIWWD